MPRYNHHLEYNCDACGSSWDEPGDALDETISLDGTKLDGPTPCTNCDSMDVEVIAHSDEVDGMDEYTAAMERKADQESGR